MRKKNSTNHLNEKTITQGCPITSTMLAIGGRWKLIILWHLRTGVLRYNEIKKPFERFRKNADSAIEGFNAKRMGDQKRLSGNSAPYRV